MKFNTNGRRSDATSSAAMLDVVARAIRKMRNLERPAPVETIFSQFGNTGLQRKITANRAWQYEFLESLAKDGIVVGTILGNQRLFRVVDKDALDAYLHRFISHAGQDGVVGNVVPHVSAEDLLETRSVSRASLLPFVTAAAGYYAPSPDSAPKRTIVSAKWQLSSDADVEGIVPHYEREEDRKSEPSAVKSVAPSANPTQVVREITNVQEAAIEDVPTSLPPAARAVENESVLAQAEETDVPAAPKSNPKPLASEFPHLTDIERRRVQLVEDVLIRLTYDEEYKRSDLFPGEHSYSEIRWQQAALGLLVSAGVIEKYGERRATRYRGIVSQVHAILEDTDWLLRLIVPSALNRVEHPAIQDEDDSTEDVEPETETSLDVAATLQAVNQASDVSEVRILLPKFYQILEYQHERISTLESELSSANSKLDELLNILRTKS